MSGVSRAQLGPSNEIKIIVANADRTLTTYFQPLKKPLLIYGGAEDNGINVYSSDTVYDLRPKLQRITGVPVYRQSITTISNNGSTKIPHTLLVDSRPYLVLQTQLYSKELNSIAGVRVDEKLYVNYVNGSGIKVIPLERTITLERERGIFVTTIYIFDFDDFVLTPIKQASLDAQELDMIYYGCVIKFWPQITLQMFAEILSHRKIETHPLLNPSEKLLSRRFSIERKVMAAIMAENVTKMTRSYPRRITHALMCREPANYLARLDLRSIFDLLRTSATVPHIAVCFNVGRGSATVIKSFNDASRHEIFQKTLNHIELGQLSIQVISDVVDVTISIYDNGKVYFEAVWAETADAKIATLDVIAATKVVIAELDELDRRIGQSGSFEPLEPDDLDINLADYTTTVPIVISSTDFRKFKTEGLMDYYAQEYISPSRYAVVPEQAVYFYFNRVVQRRQVFDFDKIARGGVMPGEKDNIMNYYIYMSNEFSRAAWERFNNGNMCRIHNDGVRVRVECSASSEYEYSLIMRHITAALLPFKHNGTMPRPKLIDIDPETFDLKKHDPNVEVYRRVCQAKRVPVILTAAEAAEAKYSKRVCPLKNMTTGDTVHYFCPYTKYPYVQARMNRHPKGYPLPCCYQLPEVKHQTSSVARSLMYGKAIPEGKYGSFPPLFVDAFGEDIMEGYRLVGVRQYTTAVSHAGFAAAYAKIFDDPHGKDVGKLSRELSVAMVATYGATDYKSLVREIRSTFYSNGETFSRYSDNSMSDMFILLSKYVRAVDILVINEYAPGKFKLDSGSSEPRQIALVIHTAADEYYPVRTVAGGYIFDTSDKLVAELLSMAAFRKQFTLDAIIAAGYQVNREYIGRDGLVCAVDISIKDGDVNVSVARSRPSGAIPAINGARDYARTPTRAQLTDIYTRVTSREFASLKSIVDAKGDTIGAVVDAIPMWHHATSASRESVSKVLSIYPLNEVAAEIEAWKPNISETFDAYQLVEYDLLKKTFLRQIYRHRDGGIRKKIHALIDTVNFVYSVESTRFNKELGEILANFQDDVKTILKFRESLMRYETRFHGKKISAMIEHTRFNFDLAEIAAIRTLDPAPAAARVKSILDPLVTLVKTAPSSVKNIYSPCPENDKAADSYCRGGKLLVIESNYLALIDILVADIKNRFMDIHDITQNYVYGRFFTVRPFETVSFVV